MYEAVIVDAVRTPIGRYGGALKNVRPDDMAALVIRTLLERTAIDGALVEDVIFGCANQAGEDNRNVARMALLLAGLPVEVAGTTVNRLCASGLEAVNRAAMAVQTGCGDFFIAGGVESMSRAPLVMAKPETAFPRGGATLQDSTLGWRFINPKLAECYYPFSMGETAENVAERYHIGRDAQDAFALASQHKAMAAQALGIFAQEIVPISVPGPRNTTTQVDRDEHPRGDTTLDALAGLRPAFREGGTVTAGNSAGINDGAAALLVCSAERARALGLRPLVRVLSHAVTGVDPAVMGIGPIMAIERAVRRAGISLQDVGVVELNEAFAAQCLAVIDSLHLDASIVNPHGGAIALGHPLGCSGARLAGTIALHMARQGIRYGVAALCVGVGQGVATVFERPSDWN